MIKQDPSKAVITSIGVAPQGGIANGVRPLIAGTGDPGNVVKLFDGVRWLGEVTVSADGTWSFEPTANLKNGKHKFTAIAVDSEGNFGVSSEPIAATLPVIEPTLVPITPLEPPPTVPKIGGWIGYIPEYVPKILGPTFGGLGHAGETIHLYDNGVLFGTGIVAADGMWMIDMSKIEAGRHDFTATATNSAGVTSAFSAHYIDTFGSSAARATITAVIDDIVDPSGIHHEFNIANGAVTSDTSPKVLGLLSGPVYEGQVVALFRDGVKIGNADVDGTAWSYQDKDVAAGKHVYTARVEVEHGISSATSSGYEIEQRPADSNTGLGGSLPIRMFMTDEYLVIDARNPEWQDPLGPVFKVGASGVDGLLPVAVKDGGLVFVTLPVDWRTLADRDSTAGIGIQKWYGLGHYPEGMGSISYGVPVGGYSFSDLAELRNNQDVFFCHHPAAPNQFAGPYTSQIDAQSAIDTAVPAEAYSSEASVESPASAFPAQSGTLTLDTTTFFKQASSHIEGGKGIDTLALSGDHQLFDLSMLSGKTAAAKVSGIEVIDLGGHQNTLKLSLTDVLNLGESDLFLKDGKPQFMVKGKEGDVLDLSNTRIAGIADGEWAQHGTVSVDAAKYAVYEHSGAHAELLVQQGVQATMH